MRKKYHELSLAKKFSLTSIGFFFLTILVLTVLIQFLYEKSVLNITSESYSVTEKSDYGYWLLRSQ